MVRSVPVRVLGKRREGDGRSEFLGSRWNEGGVTRPMARALLKAGLESALFRSKRVRYL